MDKDKNIQVIDGCQYEVEVNQCPIFKRAVVIVWQLDETMVGHIEIDHNCESASAQYKVGKGDYVEGTYNYFELPENDKLADIAPWIVQTHPNY